MSTVPDPSVTDWVPLWNLGRQPVKYLGAYSAGTTSNDGDVVVGPDGLCYICVMDGTLGTAPSWGGMFPPIGVSYGTSLPVSPIDGQEAVLVDSTTNPTYQWRFRYNASSTSAYKWEFIGGSRGHAFIGTAESTSSAGVAVDLATVGPIFTVSRAGDYEVQYGILIQSNDVGIASLWNTANTRLSGLEVDAAPPWCTGTSTDVLPGLAANTGIKMRYQSRNGGSVGFYYRSLYVTPIRVS